MDAPKEQKPEEKKPLELNILLHPDNTIEIKGEAYLSEPMSFWMLSKAKSMIENYHLTKMIEAKQEKKIIGAQNFRGFINRVRGK